MQKRERMLATAVAILCGGWLVDSMVVQPGMAWFAAVERETRDARREVGEAKALIDRQSVIMSEWRAQHAAGLLANADQARFQLQRALAAEAAASGFTIDSVSGGQVIPASDEQIYDLLRLGVSGRGTLEQVTGYIARLEAVGIPLAIERSEWSSSDARRDFLDVTLTVSTRMAGDGARAGRSIPDGTAAWTPSARDNSLDAATLAAKPFLADRHQPRAEPVVKVETEKIPPPAPVDPGWGLVGIVTTGGQSFAFVRHLGDGSEKQLTVGETIDGHTIVAIEKDGLRVTKQPSKFDTTEIDNEHEATNKNDALSELVIPVGTTLRGEAMKVSVATASAARRSSTRSSTSSDVNKSTSDDKDKPPATPFKVPAATSDPAREAILERLRQQRSRSK